MDVLNIRGTELVYDNTGVPLASVDADMLLSMISRHTIVKEECADIFLINTVWNVPHRNTIIFLDISVSWFLQLFGWGETGSACDSSVLSSLVNIIYSLVCLIKLKCCGSEPNLFPNLPHMI